MWLYHTTRLLKPILSLCWTVECVGCTSDVPRRGPLLVAANHASFVDPWFLAWEFPRTLRYLITDRWYYRSRLLQWIWHANGALPVSTGDPRRTIGDVQRYLDRGRAVAIFPEGHISHDGRIQRFRYGLARIAAVSGVQVVPVGLRGNFESIPRHRRWPKRGKIEVHVGSPRRFPGSPMAEVPPRDVLRTFTQELFEEICRLSDREPAVRGTER